MTTASICPKQDTARDFMQALLDRDYVSLAELLAPDVWFRALLPRRLVEANDASTAVETLRDWFGKAIAFEVLDSDHHEVGSRHQLRYRFRLRPDWAPDQWHDIEQMASIRVRDGLISRVDIVCTGFHPTDDPSNAIAS